MFKKTVSFLTLILLSCSICFCQNIDIQILREINLNRNRSLDGSFQFITNTLKPVTTGIPVGMLGAGLIMKDSALISNAIVIGASVVSSTILTTILKRSINRTRPYISYPEIEKMTSAGPESFPSGHTSGAFSFATSLSLQYPKWYIIVPSYTWASAVAYSRMDLGVHYPSDVLIGAALGAGSAYLCHYLNKKLLKKNKVLNWYCEP